MSGMYEMAPVRLSFRRTYVNFADAMADTMSSQRHIDKLNAPIIVTYWHLRDARLPAAESRLRRSGQKPRASPCNSSKRLTTITLRWLNRLAIPYGPNGRAALALMKLAPT